MKPILYSPPMVQAIIDELKWKTRRILKVQPDCDGVRFMPNAPLNWQHEWKPWKFDTEDGESHAIHCPYGEVGDMLYVRENWKLKGWHFEDGEAAFEFSNGDEETIYFEEPFDYKKGQKQPAEWLAEHIEVLHKQGVLKLVDPDAEKDDEENYRFEFTGKKHSFRPGIHLPKWASRIFLKIKSLKVERLQDISEDDAQSEGIHKPINGSYVEGFKKLWCNINGPGSWEANPWVWVIEFEQCEKPKL